MQSLLDNLYLACQQLHIAKMERLDTQIVIISKGNEAYELLDEMLKEDDIKKLSSWDGQTRSFIYERMRVTVFFADADNFGFQIWLRSGPAESVSYVMARLRELGFYQKNNYLCSQSDMRVQTPSEHAFFNLLGLPFIPVAERSIDRYKWAMAKFTIQINPQTKQLSLFDDNGTMNSLEWRTPWLITDAHSASWVWICDIFFGKKRAYRAVPIDHKDAEAQYQSLYGTLLYQFETVALENHIENNGIRWSLVPPQLYSHAADLDSEIGDFEHCGSVSMTVHPKHFRLLQSQYHPAIADYYQQAETNVDGNNNIPAGYKFVGCDNVYISDGTHRAIAHWKMQKPMEIEVFQLPYSIFRLLPSVSFYLPALRQIKEVLA